MSETFNLNNKSDMSGFEKALKDAIFKQAGKAIEEKRFDVECPFCGSKFQAQKGDNICPDCGKTVELDLNIKL